MPWSRLQVLRELEHLMRKVSQFINHRKGDNCEHKKQHEALKEKYKQELLDALKEHK